MTFATWWRSDPVPRLAPLPSFSAQVATNTGLIASLTTHAPHAIATRFERGNRCYLAFMGDIAVAYGWVASQEGGIAELGWTFALPAGNCYLYNFRTLPAWRGRGIYPQLLQAILHQESFFDRFWIGYLPDNVASGRGISKAGFEVVSELVVTDGRVCGLTLYDAHERARASAEVFQLSIVGAPGT